MVRTCHQCHGRADGYAETNLKRCAGCQKVYYCSTGCQKHDWVVHIFDCKPKRPINTADQLALSVRKNAFPEHLQTREDYGFNRAASSQGMINLLGLYTCLMEVLKIPPKTIHDWRVRGVLVDEIKSAFAKYPDHASYTWFLQNQHIIALAGQPLSLETWHEQGDRMVEKAWRFIGGNVKDTAEEIRAKIESKPEGEQECFWLYVFLLSRIHPGPGDQRWIDFGFAACASQEEEMALGGKYQILITMCTFSQFCDAFREGRLLDLFRSKGVPINNSRHFGDVVRRPRKSVWNLKAFVLQEDDDGDEQRMVPSVRADYGFMNCKNASEVRQLKRVYKAFFETHDGDPLALHEAAIRGDIHGFLSKHVQGLRDPKFRRLMKNLYPLPDL